MPKDKSNRDYASHKIRDCPYKPLSSHGKGTAAARGKGLEDDDSTLKKDWEDATCSICMEIPHNAVLLRCSSYEKGCRPYMCDTSYRHSNCLDQYCKAHTLAQKAHVYLQQSGLFEATNDDSRSSAGDTYINNSVRISRHSRSTHMAGTSEYRQSRISEAEFLDDEALEGADGWRRSPSLNRPVLGATSLRGCDLLGLLCPLCRGDVRGWEVVKAARHFLNKKTRNCAQEACAFAGSYEELRAHARRDHPTARPAEIDPARERDWRRLERQRDLGDVLSTIRSAMPGATVLGDYVIDGQEDSLHSYDGDFPSDEGHLLTVFLLFQVFGPSRSITGGRSFPPFRGVARGHHRTGSSRRQLWGETSQSSGSNTYGDGSSSRRQRRNQSRPQG